MKHLNYGEFEGPVIIIIIIVIIPSKDFDVRIHPSAGTPVAMHFHFIS
jgi:hypothetical protein